MRLIKNRRTPEKRNKTTDSRYNTYRWKQTRLRVLLRDNYLCECETCKASKVPRLALKKGGVVDHIKPVSQGGDFWDENNMRAMNKHCHAIKSQSERKR